MTKVVYNACYGGFGLSTQAIARYCQLKNISVPKYFDDCKLSRTDPALIQVIEELGDDANASYAELRFHELAPGTLYRIKDYDGNETVVTHDHGWQVA
jgi:hypothetical protein